MTSTNPVAYFTFNWRLQKQEGPFQPTAFEAEILASPEEAHLDLYVWKTGWKDWVPALDFRRSIEPMTQFSEPPQPPPSPVGIQAVTEPAAAMPSTEAVTEREKRIHERHAVRLRCIIRNESVTFRTFTRDVSLGGVALEQAIPSQLFNQNCQIYIGSLDGRENIRFDLTLTSRGELRYFAFSGLDKKRQKKLGDWLTKLNSPQNKKTKLKVA